MVAAEMKALVVDRRRDAQPKPHQNLLGRNLMVVADRPRPQGNLK